MEIGTLSAVISTCSACFVLYNMFYHVLHETLVNAQPLGPPFVEEIAKISLLSSRLRFIFFLFLVVDCRVPLADPGSMLDRVWCHLWSNVSALSAAQAELLQRSSKKFRKKLR